MGETWENLGIWLIGLAKIIQSTNKIWKRQEIKQGGTTDGGATEIYD